MADIKIFLVENVVLFSILACLVGAYGVFEFFFNSSDGALEVSGQNAVDLFNHQQAVLLDIRNSADFNACHCVGSISVHSSQGDLAQFKDKPVVVICYSGRSSLSYAKELIAKGFTGAKSLAGGINAWRNDGLPTVEGR